MIAVMLHPKSSFDQHRDPLSGPELRTIAVRRGSLRQQDDQLSLLVRRQQRRAARRGLGLQRSAAAAAPRITPPKYAAGMTSNPAHNLMQRQPLSQQVDHLTSPLLQILRRTVRSHRGTPFQDASIIAAVNRDLAILDCPSRSRLL